MNFSDPFFTFCAIMAKLAAFIDLSIKTMVIYKKFLCVICGFIYNEAEGWPEDGIEAGTLWENVPENWFCPDCGASKEDFEMIEIE